MLTFSTDDLPAKDRFAHWREERGKAVFGVTIELHRSRHAEFEGHFSAKPVGPAMLVEMRASPYKVHRTESDIARAPSDALCIYQQMDGGGWFDAGGSEFVVPAGKIATSHSDLPYATQPSTEAGYNLRLLKIPFARCKGLVESEQPLFARPLDVEPGHAALLSETFNAFVAAAPSLSSERAEAAIETLAQLALVARGLAAPASDQSRRAIRASLLRKAHRAIERNLHRSDLSPAIVAGLLGISVRSLHLLFEPTGQSFSRTVVAIRLGESCRLLQQDPERQVSDIAFSCGFESLATFYRVFRRAYGMPPTDYRLSMIEQRR
jgi:AraC-like DNA-binding protein